MAPRNGDQVVEAVRDPAHVHRHDRPRVGRYAALDVGRVEAERVVDLRHNRHGPGRDDRAGRGHVGVGRDDDLVAGADARGLEGADQGGGAGVDDEGVPYAEEIGDLLFEEVALRVVAVPEQVLLPEDVGRGGDLFVAEHAGARHARRDGRGHRRCPTVDREFAWVLHWASSSRSLSVMQRGESPGMPRCRDGCPGPSVIGDLALERAHTSTPHSGSGPAKTPAPARAGGAYRSVRPMAAGRALPIQPAPAILLTPFGDACSLFGPDALS